MDTDAIDTRIAELKAEIEKLEEEKFLATSKHITMLYKLLDKFNNGWKVGFLIRDKNFIHVVNDVEFKLYGLEMHVNESLYDTSFAIYARECLESKFPFLSVAGATNKGYRVSFSFNDLELKAYLFDYMSTKGVDAWKLWKESQL